MFFKILLNYLFGYAEINIEGYFIERFINICISKNILLWNLKRKKSTILYTNIAIKDFKKIRQIAKTTKCRVKIEKKKGLPFLLHRYKKRKIFLGLLIVFLLTIFSLSNFVWNIEVIGNENISSEEIVKCLNEYGLKTGIPKAKVDTKDIINKMRLQRDDLAWIGIKIIGTNALVEVVEADKKPEITNEEEYCNIVSNQNGIITKINVQNGTALVKVGDIVTKRKYYCWRIFRREIYTELDMYMQRPKLKQKFGIHGKEKMSLNGEITEETGQTKNTYQIALNNFKINFPKGVPNFKNYDTINTSKKLKIFSNFYFPIEFTKTTYKEQTKIPVKYTEEEAKQKLITKLEAKLKNQIQDETKIVNTQINSNLEGETLEVELIYEVLENIGTNEKILF